MVGEECSGIAEVFVLNLLVLLGFLFNILGQFCLHVQLCTHGELLGPYTRVHGNIGSGG